MIKKSVYAPVLLLISLACSNEGPEAPTVTSEAVPEKVEEEKNPLDLRRTTLVVSDIEASLALYRDALGMEVAYDQELTSPNLGRSDDDGVNRSRLVLLKANDDFIGMLGLWQFLDRAPTEEKARTNTFDNGDIVLLFNSEDLERHYPAATAVQGVEGVSPPKLRIYPGPNGMEIKVMVSMLSDPDGHTIELNQILEDPRRAE